jgi:hypothetical protein
MNETYEYTSGDPIPYNVYSVDVNPDVVESVYETITGSDWGGLLTTLGHWWDIYSVVAILVSLLLFSGFVYAKIRLGQLAEEEHDKLHGAEHAWAHRHSHHESKNTRWEVIQARASERNPESWRVAIIEADILLDETLRNAGYVGQTLGEMLKSANTSSFTTIQDAWEAHKVRNEIAHTGSDFVLTERATKETLLRFERVFREFGVI